MFAVILNVFLLFICEELLQKSWHFYVPSHMSWIDRYIFFKDKGCFLSFWFSFICFNKIREFVSFTVKVPRWSNNTSNSFYFLWLLQENTDGKLLNFVQ